MLYQKGMCVLSEKIKSRKLKEGHEEPAKPLSAIEDFCERFDRAVKNTIVAKVHTHNDKMFIF